MNDSSRPLRRRSVVLIGAGLGGCFLADRLADDYDVRIIELGNLKPRLEDRVSDVLRPAVTYPHICSGLGGTTRLWHNGLIEISEDVFAKCWPFGKAVLAPYYRQAFEILSGRSYEAVARAAMRLLEKYQAFGFGPGYFRHWLFYPKNRVNPWHLFRLAERVPVTFGEVVKLAANGQGQIERVSVKSQDGEIFDVSGDVFVLAAGGLGTPIILQRSGICGQAGSHYEDHPCAVVGEVILNEALFRLWNFPCERGNLRLPFFFEQDGLQISFQLRPIAHSWIASPSKRVKGVINELRNNPFRLGLYFKLAAHFDDLMEILSFKLNLNLPTKHYSILMVAEQTPAPGRAVWSDGDGPAIQRRWDVGGELLNTYARGIESLLRSLGPLTRSVTIYPEWERGIYSSSHHSGTARMASNEGDGACDRDLRVFGVGNLFICDGSVIPGTGIANTGLTIAALALKLADHIKTNFPAVPARQAKMKAGAE